MKVSLNITRMLSSSNFNKTFDYKQSSDTFPGCVQIDPHSTRFLNKSASGLTAVAATSTILNAFMLDWTLSPQIDRISFYKTRLKHSKFSYKAKSIKNLWISLEALKFPSMYDSSHIGWIFHFWDTFLYHYGLGPKTRAYKYA